MSTRTFALIFGAAFLLIGIAGFIPGISQPVHGGHPGVSVDASSANVFGLFPVNILHDLVHILFGVWGLIASRSLDAAKTYARVTAVVYTIFVVMGLVPGLNTTFGLVPLFGHDIWLHLLLAAPAAYFGFVHRDTRAHS